MFSPLVPQKKKKEEEEEEEKGDYYNLLWKYRPEAGPLTWK